MMAIAAVCRKILDGRARGDSRWRSVGPTPLSPVTCRLWPSRRPCASRRRAPRPDAASHRASGSPSHRSPSADRAPRAWSPRGTAARADSAPTSTAARPPAVETDGLAAPASLLPASRARRGADRTPSPSPPARGGGVDCHTSVRLIACTVCTRAVRAASRSAWGARGRRRQA